MPKCARPGCENPVRSGWFACRPDWMDLPREIRHAIFNAFRQPDRIKSPEYVAAIRRAREYWDR